MSPRPTVIEGYDGRNRAAKAQALEALEAQIAADMRREERQRNGLSHRAPPPTDNGSGFGPTPPTSAGDDGAEFGSELPAVDAGNSSTSNGTDIGSVSPPAPAGDGNTGIMGKLGSVASGVGSMARGVGSMAPTLGSMARGVGSTLGSIASGVGSMASGMFPPPAPAPAAQQSSLTTATHLTPEEQRILADIKRGDAMNASESVYGNIFHALSANDHAKRLEREAAFTGETPNWRADSYLDYIMRNAISNTDDYKTFIKITKQYPIDQQHEIMSLYEELRDQYGPPLSLDASQAMLDSVIEEGELYRQRKAQEKEAKRLANDAAYQATMERHQTTGQPLQNELMRLKEEGERIRAGHAVNVDDHNRRMRKLKHKGAMLDRGQASVDTVSDIQSLHALRMDSDVLPTRDETPESPRKRSCMGAFCSSRQPNNCGGRFLKKLTRKKNNTKRRKKTKRKVTKRKKLNSRKKIYKVKKRNVTKRKKTKRK